MRITVPLTIALSLLTVPALAQIAQPQPAPMRSMELIPPDTASRLLDEKKQADESRKKDAEKSSGEQHLELGKPQDDEKSAKESDEKSDDKKTEEAPKSDTPKTNTGLTPVKDLKPWGKSDELYTALANPARAKKALDGFAGEPERVDPADLLRIAALYAANDDMKLAARYYYAAQLRARFDYLRWPLEGADSPYQSLINDIKEQHKIASWATGSSSRLGDVIDDVRTWDAATGYSYHPGYPLPEGDKIPKEDAWPQLLTQAREKFFLDSGKIIMALKTMKK
jgi:hypothetical protein